MQQCSSHAVTDGIRVDVTSAYIGVRVHVLTVNACVHAVSNISKVWQMHLVCMPLACCQPLWSTIKLAGMLLGSCVARIKDNANVMC